MKRSCSQLCLDIACTKSHLGLSQHESGIRQKEWFPQPQIRNQCPLIQLLLLSVVPGVQAESKELFQIYAASAETRIRCRLELHPMITQLCVQLVATAFQFCFSGPVVALVRVWGLRSTGWEKVLQEMPCDPPKGWPRSRDFHAKCSSLHTHPASQNCKIDCKITCTLFLTNLGLTYS